MSDFSERLLTGSRQHKGAPIQPFALVLVPLAAILFQVYVTHIFPLLDFLELPLLVTLHFSLRRRGPLSAVFYGCAIGLVQDSLSGNPLGMYGIVKTLVGYFAASVSQRFEVEHPASTVVLSFFFYFFHRFFYWVLARALLGQLVSFDPQQALIFGLLNAVVAIPFFHILDRLRETA
ncbi:MAG TPA: rod shape-determining protein MreD [Bryobacteraceae bacterium]|jgi:rod shape-determining protein MreD|nr:rod shape-determining protein MreD [Bryobacteraceae bacterium]